MIRALKRLFADDAPGHSPHDTHHLHVAVACLLYEAMRVDRGEHEAEQKAALRALGELFSSAAVTAETLLAEGRHKAQHLTSYYAPLATIKRVFSLEQRIVLVEHLWRIAYADGKLDPEEDHFVRKMAHLLYVPNTQSMLARSRVRTGH